MKPSDIQVGKTYRGVFSNPSTWRTVLAVSKTEVIYFEVIYLDFHWQKVVKVKSFAAWAKEEVK